MHFFLRVVNIMCVTVKCSHANTIVRARTGACAKRKSVMLSMNEFNENN